MKLVGLLSSAAFLACTVALFAPEARAQCVACVPRGSVFNCDPSPKGGQHCATDEGGRLCGLEGACGADELLVRRTASVSFKRQLLRQIGQLQPRFAVILSFVERQNLLAKGQARIFMIPSQISEEDVERAITSDAHATSIKQFLKDRTRRESQPDVVPLEYRVTLEESADSTTGVIRLDVVKGYALDPSYSSLEIDVESKGKATSRRIAWKASKFRIN